jgi:hypothetical protein
LGLLKDAEWRELILRYLPEVTEGELSAIQRLAGGHPFYTQLAAGRLWEARCAGGDPDWQSRALVDLEPHWAGWWRHLKPKEQAALRFTAGLPAPQPKEALLKDIQRRGLLRDSKPFSAAFAEWIKEQ